MEKAEKVPPALREPVVNHDWFHYIYTYLQVLCIYNWHAPDGWCFSQNIFALDLNVSICPILTCFVVGGRPSYLCQTREAPACCFDFFILKPNVFQDICISYVSFIQHAKWPAKIAWSGLVTLCWFWCSSSAGHFYMFPAESWAQTRSTPFLDGQPTTLTCLAISESLKLVWFHWISELFLWWWQDSLKKKISTRFACSVLWSLVVVMWACLTGCKWHAKECGHFRIRLERIGLSALSCMQGWWLHARFHWVLLPSLFALWIFSHLLPCLQKYCAYMVNSSLLAMRALMATGWQHDSSMCP